MSIDGSDSYFNDNSKSLIQSGTIKSSSSKEAITINSASYHHSLVSNADGPLRNCVNNSNIRSINNICSIAIDTSNSNENKNRKDHSSISSSSIISRSSCHSKRNNTNSSISSSNSEIGKYFDISTRSCCDYWKIENNTTTFLKSNYKYKRRVKSIQLENFSENYDANCSNCIDYGKQTVPAKNNQSYQNSEFFLSSKQLAVSNIKVINNYKLRHNYELFCQLMFGIICVAMLNFVSIDIFHVLLAILLKIPKWQSGHITTFVKCLRQTIYQLINVMSKFCRQQFNKQIKRNYFGISIFIAIVMAIGSIQMSEAGACWNSGPHNKCSHSIAYGMSKEECCSLSGDFSYTTKDLSPEEYFFISALDGGVACTPCQQKCDGKCGAGMRCAIRKGRPKCICAPICKSPKRLTKIKKSSGNHQMIEISRNSDKSQLVKYNSLFPNREIRSLSSEILHPSGSVLSSSFQLHKNHADKTNQRIHSKTKNQRSQMALVINPNQKLIHGRQFKLIDGTKNAPTLKLMHHDHNSSSKFKENRPKTRKKQHGRFNDPIQQLTHHRRTNNNQKSTIYNQSYQHKLRQQQNRKHGKARHHQNYPIIGQNSTSNINTASLSSSSLSSSSSSSTSSSSSFSKLPFRRQYPALIDREKPTEAEWRLDGSDNIQIGFLNHGFQYPNQMIIHGEYNNPVCGTDGRTYKTECQLKKRACRQDISSLKVAYRGYCQTSCHNVSCSNSLTCVEDQLGYPHCIQCSIQCSENDDDPNKAVCGMDGRTYKSACDINRMICLTGRSVGVAYVGPCQEESSCNTVSCGPRKICLTDYATQKPRCVACGFKCRRSPQPSGMRHEDGKICGNNNRTYNSWCQMKRDSCHTEFYIDVKHVGACHNKD